MDRWRGALGTALVASLLWTAPALAGTYDVNACATPAGKFTNHSWTIAVNGPQFASTSCQATDARPYIWVGSVANKLYDPGQAATMTFSAPSGTTIVDFWVHRYLQQFNPIDGTSGRDYLYSLGQLGGMAFESTGHPDPRVRSALADRWYRNGESYEGEETVTKASFSALAGYRGDATFLRYTVGCYTSPCALQTSSAAGSINAQIFGATVTVNDPTAPTVGRVFPTGLAAGGIVGGNEPLTFDVGDNTGIKRAELLDVTAEPARVVATKDFACDYSYATPCPAAQGAQITPSQIDGGARTLQLRVTDAAGNVGLGDKFSVEVGGPLNGTPANAAAKLTATFKRNKRHSLSVGFGKRGSVRGRLVDATNTPIAGAAVQVLGRLLRTGSTQYSLLGEATTDAKGRFSFLPSTGPARAFRFEYRSRKLLAAPNAVTRVTMRVRAGVTLKISPRHVRPGGTIKLSGRLLGGPVPLSGKVVDLQAYEAGRWRTFDTVRARKRARYATRYRFQRAAGKTIAFRTRVRRDDSYPYYLGYSRRVKVRIG